MNENIFWRILVNLKLKNQILKYSQKNLTLSSFKQNVISVLIPISQALNSSRWSFTSVIICFVESINTNRQTKQKIDVIISKRDKFI